MRQKILFILVTIGVAAATHAQTGISAGPGASITMSGGGSGCGVGSACTIAAGGTGATTASGALTNLGAFAYPGATGIPFGTSATVSRAATAADITTLLGFTPLNPANNLSDLSSSATARVNLGAVGWLIGTGAPAATCSSSVNAGHLYVNSANAAYQCNNQSGTYAWQLISTPQAYPAAGVAISSGSAWGSSIPIQGTGTKLLSSGTIAGSSSIICTDSGGGESATTSGCLSLTTSGVSGAATFSAGVLNIPRYDQYLAVTVTGSNCAGATYTAGVLNIPPCSPGGTVYPGAGIPNSTGTAWGTSYTAQGTNTKLLTTSGGQGIGLPVCGDTLGGASGNSTAGCYDAGQSITGQSVQTSTTNWSTCILPGCNPGGTTAPTSTSITSGNASPSLSGNSMHLSMTCNASNCNALWPYKIAACDSCTYYYEDFYIYPGSNSANASAFEMDLFSFDKSQAIEYMWGLQWYKAGSVWQVFNQNTNAWVNTSVTTSLAFTTWHHIQVWDHRVQGDTASCSGQPCMYYDAIAIDGIKTNWNLSYPAGTLPSGWAGNTGVQFQIDTQTVVGTQTLDMYVDQANFIGYSPANASTVGGWNFSAAPPSNSQVPMWNTADLQYEPTTIFPITAAQLPSAIGPETIVYTNSEYSNGTCSTALTLSPANGNKQKVTLTAGSTCALTFTQPSSGTATIQVKVTQSASGSFNGGISGCKWPGGIAPTITQTTGAVDMISAYLDGTNAYCQIAQSFQ